MGSLAPSRSPAIRVPPDRVCVTTVTPNIKRTMRRNNVGEIDRRVIDGMRGRDKLALLMTQQSGSIARWAIARGINPPEIHHTLRGYREYPQHRDLMARDLGLTREQVDQLIGR